MNGRIFRDVFSLHENKPTVLSTACQSLADTTVNESIEASVPQRSHLDETCTVNNEPNFL